MKSLHKQCLCIFYYVFKYKRLTGSVRILHEQSHIEGLVLS